jgi:predicted small metal-binding protein
MDAHGILRCDCGFEAVGDDAHELATAARDHARERHGVELAADAITALVGEIGMEPRDGEGSA